jgi:hypothetical protein
MTPSQQAKNDARIEQLHAQAAKYWPQLEKIVDELKTCGRHSLNGDNALQNVRESLRDLAQR